jgi:membrane associated rhomboid family serine protease
MGIYDRDYAHEPESGFHLNAPQTMTTKLVLVTVAVYVAQLFIGIQFTDFFSLDANWWRHPWEAFQLLTYGFLHSPDSFQHIFWNMFGLWMFGREVEQRYGAREILGFYLSAIIFSGLMWSLAEWSQGTPAHILGASGGTTAVIILFALTYPHRTVYLGFFFPVPAWIMGLFIVGGDIYGSMLANDQFRGGKIAFAAHLAGTAYSFFYFHTRWNPLEKLLGLTSNLRGPRKAKLRVHKPESDGDDQNDDEVDRILRKISETGKDSLTSREQRYLEKASQEFKNRRR